MEIVEVAIAKMELIFKSEVQISLTSEVIESVRIGSGEAGENLTHRCFDDWGEQCPLFDGCQVEAKICQASHII